MIEASRRLERILTLVATTLVATFAATAAGNWGSGPPLPDPGDLNRAPGELSILNETNSPSDRAGLLADSVTAGDVSTSIGLDEVLEPIPLGDGYMLSDYGPHARIESTGTWLQRGYWYAQEEAVVFVRSFNKKNTLLAQEFTGQTTDPITFRPVAIYGRSLQIRTGHPVFASARLTLGRFMFRDDGNRDHFTEVSFLGAGKEQQHGTVLSRFGNGLLTPVLLGAGNQDFSGSDSQEFVYTHSLNTLEFNYRVKGRMDRDQMVLLPDGNWVRRARETNTREFIAGLRWLSMNEWLVWEAAGNRNGDMRISTHNNLLGFQMGFGDYRDFARFSIGVRGKAGVYVNFTDLARDFRLFDGGTAVQPPDRVRAEEETLAFVGEVSGIARYHIHQNFSLRISGEIMYVDSIATAPIQTTFAPRYDVVAVHGNSLYLGVGFGIEGYW